MTDRNMKYFFRPVKISINYCWPDGASLMACNATTSTMPIASDGPGKETANTPAQAAPYCSATGTKASKQWKLARLMQVKSMWTGWENIPARLPSTRRDVESFMSAQGRHRCGLLQAVSKGHWPKLGVQLWLLL